MALRTAVKWLEELFTCFYYSNDGRAVMLRFEQVQVSRPEGWPEYNVVLARQLYLSHGTQKRSQRLLMSCLAPEGSWTKLTLFFIICMCDTCDTLLRIIAWMRRMKRVESCSSTCAIASEVEGIVEVLVKL